MARKGGGDRHGMAVRRPWSWGRGMDEARSCASMGGCATRTQQSGYHTMQSMRTHIHGTTHCRKSDFAPISTWHALMPLAALPQHTTHNRNTTPRQLCPYSSTSSKRWPASGVELHLRRCRTVAACIMVAALSLREATKRSSHLVLVPLKLQNLL